MQIRKAQRSQSKLRIALCGASGSGKTYSALSLATGIGQKIGLIDTENYSADLYADKFDFDVINLDPPFTVESYISAIESFEKAGYDVIIIDSLSHAWAGQGGLLDKQNSIAESSKAQNSWAAWRQITPEHNRLVDKIIRCKAHVIGCMRSKQEYSQEKDSNGKTRVVKLGMAPVMRDGIEYEFTTVFMVEESHHATSSKDRTGLFDGEVFMIDKSTGERFMDWLSSGGSIEEELLKLKGEILSCETKEEARVKYLEMSGLVNKIKLVDSSLIDGLIADIESHFKAEGCNDEVS